MFIKENRIQYPLALVCEVLQVSPSGYHKWLKNKVSFRVKENQKRNEDDNTHNKKVNLFIDQRTII
jgi:hypothetical protein